MKIKSILEAAITLPKTQEQILDAAVDCVRRWGLDRVSLNDIANEARVARSTIYKYYKNCDEVIQSSLLRSAYNFSEKLFAHVDTFKTPEERTIEGIIFSLKTLPDEPSFKLLSSSTLTHMVHDIALKTHDGEDLGITLFKTIILAEDGQYSDDQLQELSEFTIRFMLSLLTMESPKERTEDEMRGFIARSIFPVIGFTVPAEYQIY